MNYKIMSRQEAIQYSKEQHNDKSIIISISGTMEEFPHFNSIDNINNIMSILYMTFDDIQESGKDKNGNVRYKYFFGKNNNGIMSNTDLLESNLKLFNKQDAEIIYDFVSRWEDKVDTIIVHCSAGISRSSGCCAAIIKALEGDDSGIFGCKFFHPNMTVYNVLLKEFAKNGYTGVFGKHKV